MYWFVKPWYFLVLVHQNIVFPITLQHNNQYEYHRCISKISSFLWQRTPGLFLDTLQCKSKVNYMWLLSGYCQWCVDACTFANYVRIFQLHYWVINKLALFGLKMSARCYTLLIKSSAKTELFRYRNIDTMVVIPGELVLQPYSGVEFSIRMSILAESKPIIEQFLFCSNAGWHGIGQMYITAMQSKCLINCNYRQKQ